MRHALLRSPRGAEQTTYQHENHQRRRDEQHQSARPGGHARIIRQSPAKQEETLVTLRPVRSWAWTWAAGGSASPCRTTPALLARPWRTDSAGGHPSGVPPTAIAALLTGGALTTPPRSAPIVVGLPKRLNGQRHPYRRPMRARSPRLCGAVPGLDVHLQDERLTSHEADMRLAERERDWRRRKDKLDAASPRPSFFRTFWTRVRVTCPSSHTPTDAQTRLLTSLLCLLVAAGASAFWMRARLTTPYRGFGTDPECSSTCRSVSASPGSRRRLAAAGVVPDAVTFRIAARLAGVERRLQAGEYRFADAATPLRRRRATGARRCLCAARHVSRRPDDPRDGRDLRAERPGHRRRLRAGRARTARWSRRSIRKRTRSRAICFPTPTRFRASAGADGAVRRDGAARLRRPSTRRCARRRPRRS